MQFPNVIQHIKSQFLCLFLHKLNPNTSLRRETEEIASAAPPRLPHEHRLQSQCHHRQRRGIVLCRDRTEQDGRYEYYVHQSARRDTSPQRTHKLGCWALFRRYTFCRFKYSFSLLCSKPNPSVRHCSALPNKVTQRTLRLLFRNAPSTAEPGAPRSNAIHSRASRPTPHRHQLSPGPAETAWWEPQRSGAGGSAEGVAPPHCPELRRPTGQPAQPRHAPLTGDLHAGLGPDGGGCLLPLLVLLLRRPRRCTPSSLQSRWRAGAAPGFGPALPLHGGGGRTATVGARRPASSPPRRSLRGSGCQGRDRQQRLTRLRGHRPLPPLHVPSPPRPEPTTPGTPASPSAASDWVGAVWRHRRGAVGTVMS